ncbi:4-hydroxybenzoate octaprenyltransferase [Legionella beliardensis]|uniref:4-hydroxybenzoate octaprenyltransferase n=1 Tax=Legionella beliardensis TaxID=91822 RepID=A0A378JPJ6_9GAMM|nr:4-hydroxybenzoate octaprenyltransferase [Legionella beliardensis]
MQSKFRDNLYHLVKLLRINQWVKNIFVLLPLGFLKSSPSVESLGSLFLALFLFIIASSTVYIVNDIHDIETDKNHAIKCKNRPLASGDILPRKAMYYLCVLYGILFYFFLIQFQVMCVISCYIILNYAYTFKLKSIPIIDALCIALGFVLRFCVGVIALQSSVFFWSYGIVFFLSFSIILMKREREMANNSYLSRKVLSNYNRKITAKLSLISAWASILCFLFYAFTIHNNYFIFLLLFLFIFWIFWFRHINQASMDNDCPVNIFSSNIILILLFLIIFFLSIIIKGISIN